MRARVCAGTCRLQGPRVGARDKDDSDYGWMASPIGGKTATLVTSPGALPCVENCWFPRLYTDSTAVLMSLMKVVIE